MFEKKIFTEEFVLQLKKPIFFRRRKNKSYPD